MPQLSGSRCEVQRRRRRRDRPERYPGSPAPLQKQAWIDKVMPPVEQHPARHVVDPGADARQPAALRAGLPARGPRRRRAGRRRLEHRGGLVGAGRRAWRWPATRSPTSRACWSPTSIPIITAWPGGCRRPRGAWVALHPKRRGAAARPLRRRPRWPRLVALTKTHLIRCGVPDEIGRPSSASLDGNPQPHPAGRGRRPARGRRPGRHRRLGPAGGLDAGPLARATSASSSPNGGCCCPATTSCRGSARR